MRRVILLFAVAVIIISVAVAIWIGRESVDVDLGGGRRLRIQHVSVGTDHLYSREHPIKRFLRRVSPKQAKRFLGPAGEHRFGEMHSSLVIWVTEFNVHGSEVRPSFTKPETVLDDGTAVAALHFQDANRQSSISFRSYARDRKYLKVRLSNKEGNTVTFHVRNPAPVRPSKWVAKPMPQTNHVGPVRVVLRHASPLVSIVAVDRGNRSHWTSWTITRFDDLGNWDVSRTGSSIFTKGWPPLPKTNSVVRLMAEGIIFVSAGPITQSTNNEFAILNTATNFGVRFLAFFNPGVYEISNRMVLPDPARDPATVSSLRSATGGTRLHLSTTMPGILALVEDTNMVSVRVRERLPKDQGRIFRTHRVMSVITGDASAGFYLPNLPVSATNLEVEVIVRLPPTDFFIEPGLFQPLSEPRLKPLPQLLDPYWRKTDTTASL